MNLSISCCAERHSDRSRRKRGFALIPPLRADIWLIAINPRRIRTASSPPSLRKRTRKSLNLGESLLNPVCVLRHKASFVLLTSTPPQSSLQVARISGRGRENFSLSVSCFIITLCRMERRFITIPVFGGRKRRRKKVWEALKVLVSSKGLSVVTAMNNRSTYRPRASSQQSNQV